MIKKSYMRRAQNITVLPNLETIFPLDDSQCSYQTELMKKIEFYITGRDKLSDVALGDVVEKEIEQCVAEYVNNFVHLNISPHLTCYRSDENVFDIYFEGVKVLEERPHVVDGYEPELRVVLLAGHKIAVKAEIVPKGWRDKMRIISDLLKISAPFNGIRIKEITRTNGYSLAVAPANKLQQVLDMSHKIYEGITAEINFDDLMEEIGALDNSTIDVKANAVQKRLVHLLKTLGADI